ncbi:MAG: conjugal transfer protein TraD [Pseudomonadota bacterium]
MQRNSALQIHKQRRIDTRQKIELGGLLIKAGMRDFDKAALYAGLLELAVKIDDPEEFKRLKKMGDTAF